MGDMGLEEGGEEAGGIMGREREPDADDFKDLF